MLLCMSPGSGRIRIKHKMCRNWDSLSLTNWYLLKIEILDPSMITYT
jgi:hypothetical protein